MEQQELVPVETTYQQTESPFGTAEYASTGQRFASYLIDLVIFYIIMLGLGAVMGIIFALTGNIQQLQTTNTFTGNKLTDYLVSYIIYALFYTFSEGASRGRSIGKLITRTKAVKEDESEVSWKDALIRSLCRIVPFEPFSALGGSPWHDQWSHTKVIKVTKKPVRNF